MTEIRKDAACNQTSVLYSPSTFYQREVFVHFICSINCHIQLQKQRRRFFMQADHWAQIPVYTKETPEPFPKCRKCFSQLSQSCFIYLVGFCPFFIDSKQRDRKSGLSDWFPMSSSYLGVPVQIWQSEAMLQNQLTSLWDKKTPKNSRTKAQRKEKHTVLSKGKWCFKVILLHTVVKYANQPGRRWEHKQYWVSPDALSQLEEGGIKHKGH